MGKRRSCDDAVWGSAVISEFARADVAAPAVDILLDIRQLCDCIGHRALWHCSESMVFPAR
eukprot:5323353-Lingulodinium_polyedra.AAC.1